MSRIADELYFAPDVTFANLDLMGTRLPTQFQQRIAGYYLKPAIALAESNHAFAAGLLVVCAIDALAHVVTGSNSVGGRIKAFCKKIPDLAADPNADIFCESFRNGLVHEARVKDGSEFSTDIDRVAVNSHGRLAVNPKMLAQEVLHLLNDHVAELHSEPVAKRAFVRRIKRIFRYELGN